MMRKERHLRDEDGRADSRDLVANLADGNAPGVIFEAEIEDDLGSDAVNSAVEEPPMHAKS